MYIMVMIKQIITRVSFSINYKIHVMIRKGLLQFCWLKSFVIYLLYYLPLWWCNKKMFQDCSTNYILYPPKHKKIAFAVSDNGNQARDQLSWSNPTYARTLARKVLEFSSSTHLFTSFPDCIIKFTVQISVIVCVNACVALIDLNL